MQWLQISELFWARYFVTLRVWLVELLSGRQPRQSSFQPFLRPSSQYVHLRLCPTTTPPSQIGHCATMPRSISRGRERERTRSVTPRSPDSRSPSRSPRRYISPRRSRSPSYHRNDGRRSISRSPSPASVSTKVGTRTPLNCTVSVQKMV